MTDPNQPPNPTQPASPPSPPSPAPDSPPITIAELELTRGAFKAPSVGQGVPAWSPPWLEPTMTSASSGPSLQPTPPGQRPDVVSLDTPTQWADTPQIPRQFLDPKLYKCEKRYVRIFDLSQPKDLEEYNALLSRTMDEKTNEMIVDQKMNFVKSIGSWKVLVTVQKLKYKVVVQK